MNLKSKLYKKNEATECQELPKDSAVAQLIRREGSIEDEAVFSQDTF